MQRSRSSVPRRTADAPVPKRVKRYAFVDCPFFSVPTRLYDGGYAIKMRPSMIARYCTLLRVSGFNYGKEIIPLTARELEKLDGISPRAARDINCKLLEMGLLRRSETNRRTFVLADPVLWQEIDGPKPRFQRMPSGKLTCTKEESTPKERREVTASPWAPRE